MTNIGYVQLHRQILDSRTYSRGIEYLGVMSWLILNARWQDGFYQGREVKRGQLAVTLKELSFSFKCSIQHVRTLLKNIQSDGVITIQPTSKYLLLTVVNYNIYQYSIDAVNTQINTESTAESTGISTGESPVQSQGLNTPDKEKERSKEKEYNPRKQEINTHTAPVRAYEERGKLAQILYNHYPKKYGFHNALVAILQALDDAPEASYEESFAQMLEGVLAFKEVTSFWHDKNQIMSAENFFKGQHWQDDWDSWLPRDRYGRTVEGACWDAEEVQKIKAKTQEVIHGLRR